MGRKVGRRENAGRRENGDIGTIAPVSLFPLCLLSLLLSLLSHSLSSLSRCFLPSPPSSFFLFPFHISLLSPLYLPFSLSSCSSLPPRPSPITMSPLLATRCGVLNSAPQAHISRPSGSGEKPLKCEPRKPSFLLLRCDVAEMGD